MEDYRYAAFSGSMMEVVGYMNRMKIKKEDVISIIKSSDNWYTLIFIE